MKKVKNSLKPAKNAHTANTKYGMGDFYGTGVKQKVGTMRDTYMMPKISSKNLGKAPKSLA